MTRSLLDVNVLVARLDREHVHHERARAWFRQKHAEGWATCPITQNGAVRVISQPAYSNPISVTRALELFGRAAESVHHEFWADEVSLLDPAVIDRTHLLGHRQVTDAYLLALVVAHDGRLVTFDQHVPLSAVHGATADHLTIL